MQEFLQGLFEAYPVLAPVIFIVARSLAVVIPPIPGIVIDLLGIATFGWIRGLIYAEVGLVMGSSAAFWTGRQFREPFVKRFITLQHLHKWEDEISENRKFWYLVIFRFITSPIFDPLSYAAGLTKLSAKKFAIASFIGTLPIMFVTYYFGGIFIGKGVIMGILFIVIMIIAGYGFKKWSESKYG